ncbi:MAG: hypothetical protein AABY97_08570 [Chloroflexota bacterium]
MAAKIHVGHSTSADLLFNSNFGQDSPDPVFQLVYSDGTWIRVEALREVRCSRLGPRIIHPDRISDPDQTAALNAGKHASPTSPFSATAVHC